MKEKNKLKLMKIATILQQIKSQNYTINGEAVILCYPKALNELGERIERIVYDEFKKNKKEE